ncbi:MAG: hypothetical protein U0Q07_12375 [Acidimicrobiales bacterium]
MQATAGGGGTAAASSLSGPVTVGLDFTPAADGFGFENYGTVPNRTDLTPEDVRRLFGDAVCAGTEGGTCVLTPPAQQFLEQANGAMSGGHCEGMAALALLIKKGNLSASDFGASTTGGLQIDGNDKLSREIAYWFTTQVLAPLQTGREDVSPPSEVVAKLRASFQPGATESYTLGFFKTVGGQRKDGHAVTPYGLVDRPDGKVEIALYDNNYPGAARALVVDPAAETWSYEGSPNPGVASDLYAGDASTNTLQLSPTSLRTGKLVCPVCGGSSTSTSTSAPGGATVGAAPGGAAGAAPGGSAATPTGFLFLDSTAARGGVELKVTALDGSPLPGLREIDFTTGGDLAQLDTPPALSLPSNLPFKVTIDGSKVTAETVTDVTFVGGDRDLYVDEIKVDPGQVDEATFDPARGQITYATKRDEAPTIGAGFSAEGADYAFAIGGVDLPDGGSVSATLDQAAGTFAIRNEGDATGSYALGMSRIDEAGEQTFTDPGFDLPAKASVALAYRDWSSKGDKLRVTVDPGDGSAPTTSEVQSD